MMFWNPQTTTRVIRLSVLAVLASLMFWGPTSSETLSEDILPDAQAPTKDSPQASKDNTTKTTIGGSTQPATTPASAAAAEETDQPVQSSGTSRASTETKHPTTSTDTGQRLRAGIGDSQHRERREGRSAFRRAPGQDLQGNGHGGRCRECGGRNDIPGHGSFDRRPGQGESGHGRRRDVPVGSARGWRQIRASDECGR